jgi:hypothetical protein
MTFGTWLLAGVLLATNALPSDVWPMDKRAFQIPITLDPERRAEIKEVILFVSKDQGKHWEQQARVAPDQPSFEYTAATEGEYWFTVAVVTRLGKQEPENVFTAKVSGKILVDTLKPVINVTSAERVGEEIVVKWEVKDEHPDPDTLTLDYHTAEGLPNVWTPVVVSPGTTQASFRPGSQGAVQCRLQVKDLVGNVGTATGEVAAASVTTAGNPTLPAPTPAAAPTPPPPLPTVGMSGPTSPLPSPVPPLPGGDVNTAPYRQVSQSTRNPDQPPAWTGANIGGVSVLGSPTQPGQPIASSHGMTAGAASPPSESLPPPPGQAALPAPAVPLPPLQIIKDRQINLQYTVRDLGPSGLGSVELYVTRDEGRTWVRAQGVQTVPPSVAAEGKGTPGPIQLALPVELAGEGVYGFCIVVKSKAGLGTPPPQPGTPPRLRVEVDTTPPEATLFKPQPKEGHRNTLLLTWDAHDRNLAANPVTLEWSARRDGNWQPIARDLPNTPSSYDWNLPAGVVPPRVYLRLTVRDSAGNVCVAETPEPELIDLSAPSVENISLAGPVPK